MQQPHDSGAPLGREAERQTLRQDLAAIADGQVRVVAIEGEAGIGRTRLLEATAAEAGERGFVVLAGRGREVDAGRPFGALADALEPEQPGADPGLAAVAALFRAAGEQPRPRRFRVLEDLRSLIERLARERPVLLAMDDLQWVDPGSLLALAHVARSSAGRPVGMLVALRQGLQRRPVAQFLRSPPAVDARRIPLGPLSAEAVRQLVAEFAGGEPGQELLAHVAGAGGNPLLVRELVAALSDEGSLRREDGVVRLREPVLPSSFRLLALRRLDGLPAATADALRFASLLGPLFLLTDLASVLSVAPGDLLARLDPALGQGLLDGAGQRLGFRHRLVRDAVYEQVPAAVRRALHAEIGHMLAARGANASEVAAHLGLGGESTTAEAVDWLRRAAREVAERSPAVAVELLDRALATAGPAHPAREEMLADRAIALSWCGRPDEAVADASPLVQANAGAPLEPRLRLGLARALKVQGRWTAAAAELERLAGRSGVDERERGRLLADAALARAHGAEFEASAALAEAATAAGEATGDDLTQSIALSSLATMEHLRTRPRDSLRHARQAWALALRSDSQEVGLRPTAVWLARALAFTDQFDQARAVLAVAHRRIEEGGMHWQLPLYHEVAGMIRFHAGEWDEAATELEAAVATSREVGSLTWTVPSACVLASIALHRGQDGQARSILAATARAAEPPAGISFARSHLRWVEGLLEEAAGDLGRAHARMREGWRAAAGLGLLPTHVAMCVDFVRVALAAGEPAEAAGVARQVEEVATASGVTGVAGIGLHCRGLVDRDASRLLEAVAALRQGPRRLDLALACESAGALLAEQGRVQDGLALLDEAGAEYRRLGATRDAKRVAGIPSALGVRPRPRQSRRRPAVGWEALTRTEQRVVELASQGLTNPQIGKRLFISRRTVGTHLSHVFAKLEVSSRVELAAMIREARATGSEV